MSDYFEALERAEAEYETQLYNQALSFKEGFGEGYKQRDAELKRRYCVYSDKDCSIGNIISNDIRNSTIEECIEIVRDGCYEDVNMLINFLERLKR